MSQTNNCFYVNKQLTKLNNKLAQSKQTHSSYLGRYVLYCTMHIRMYICMYVDVLHLLVGLVANNPRHKTIIQKLYIFSLLFQ